MLRKFLIGFFWSLFLIFVVPLVFLFTLSRTFFSQNFYTGPLFDRLYGFVPNFVAEQVVEAGKSLNHTFNEQEVKELLGESFDQKLLKKFVSDFFHQMSLLDNSNRTIIIQLQSFKEPFRKFVFSLITSILEKKRDCNHNEAPQDEKGFPSCIPREWRSAEFEEHFRDDVYKILESKFLENFQADQGIFNRSFSLSFERNIDQIIVFRKLVDDIPLFSVLLFLLLLLLVFFFQWKPWISNINSLGKLFITSGILTSVFGLIFYFLPRFFRPEILPPDLQTSLKTFFPFLSSLITFFATSFLTYSFLLLLGGLILYFSSKRANFPAPSS